MKKLTTILIAILTTLSVFAQQIPQSFSFQGIAKDEFGQAMQEGGLVSLRFTIYEGSGTAGNLLFQEIHNSIEIKQGGVISVNVGNGAATNGIFTEIIWNSQKTLAVGIDESNGTFFSALGNLLILSAPYSFYSENTKPFPLQELSDVNAFGITAGQVLQWNGSEWQPVDFVSSQNYTAGAGISIIGNEIINTGDTDASDDFSGDYIDLINKPISISDFSMNANSQNITNLADPIDPQDAVTKAYVDLLWARIEALENSLGILSEPIIATDIDGNVYNGIRVGSQVWMAENLRVTKYPSGVDIPHITDNTAWANLEDNDTDDAYCFYNNEVNSEYGALYTWAAAMGDNAVSSSEKPSGVQGICPDGWHLPSLEEWLEFINYRGGDVAGGKMKETGNEHWLSPNTGATNQDGFSALPGGSRGWGSGTFIGSGEIGYWWTSTQLDDSTSKLRSLSSDNAGVGLPNGSKSSGSSVRCIQD